MTNDLLQRMAAAAPQVRAWIEALVAEHAPNSRPVADAGFMRLSSYFPATVLQNTRIVTVKKIPFLPFASFGLAEFSGVEKMAAAGITYRQMCFLHEAMASESVCFHEIVHALQWKVLGSRYLFTYGIGLMQNGYARSPLEVVAFDLQSAFDRGEPLTDLVATVESRTLDAGRQVEAILREHGIGLEAGGV